MDQTPTSDGGEAEKVYQLALGHHRNGNLKAAVTDYARALKLRPYAPDIYNNLGVALRALGRAEGAVACYRRALDLRPATPGVLTNLGNALRDLHLYKRALEAHKRALKLAPDSAQALFNAALAMRDLGLSKPALEHLERAIALAPDNTEYKAERAVALLQSGDWASGFREFENRLLIDGRNPCRPGIPLWEGSSLAGKRILINVEGGAQWTVLMARFFQVLKTLGAVVIVECPAALANLLQAQSGIDETIRPGAEAPSIDVQCPLLSLPRLLGTTLESLPVDTPYINPPAIPGVELAVDPGIKLAVGLLWNGRADGAAVPGACRLEDIVELAGLSGVQLFSLQHGAAAREIETLGLDILLTDVGTGVKDAADLATVIDQLDLVITTDSLSAHLAGAMGVPTWMMLDQGAEWCWLLERMDSPWYPSMRIFRRTEGQTWSDTASGVRRAISEVIKGGG